MTQVNPPPHIKLPKKLAEDPELRAYFHNRDFIQYQLWLRSGGGSDAIDDSANFIDHGNLAIINDLADQVSSLESEVLSDQDDRESIDISHFYPSSTGDEVLPVSGDFVTTGSQIIICTNTLPIIITLNSYPDDGESVKIKRRDSLVSVVGMVDGSSPTAILDKNDGVHLIYTVATNDWSIV